MDFGSVVSLSSTGILNGCWVWGVNIHRDLEWIFGRGEGGQYFVEHDLISELYVHVTTVQLCFKSVVSCLTSYNYLLTLPRVNN